MECYCEPGYECGNCSSTRERENKFELEEAARDFALEYVGWYLPEPKREGIAQEEL